MFKHCHSCGGEYQSWVTECPDCHVPLHSAPGEAPALVGRSEPIASLENPVLLKVGEPWELRELAETLQHQGISSQIDSYPLGGSLARAGSRGQPARLGIYVAEADVAAVRELTDELAALARSESGAEAVVHDQGACPACGEPTPENAPSCASCGLEFPEVNPE
jgi:predicted amidophosphoribosyltransferase